jgi:hypothetical protein
MGANAFISLQTITDLFVGRCSFSYGDYWGLSTPQSLINAIGCFTGILTN